MSKQISKEKLLKWLDELIHLQVNPIGWDASVDGEYYWQLCQLIEQYGDKKLDVLQ